MPPSQRVFPKIRHTFKESDDDIVVSGISGYFPQCDGMEELRENLYAGVDMVTNDEKRWPRGTLGMSERSGKIKDLSRFDNEFFDITAEEANMMDPQVRMIHEVTYEAIVDAGFEPTTLRGRNIGVFVGVIESESAEALTDDLETLTGKEYSGAARSMFSNRVSHAFDFTGPSYSIDTACASSLSAINQALINIRSGQCEAAIVGGCNLSLKPANTLSLTKLNMQSVDGYCRTFDAEASGYVRAETVGCVFLQRRRDARRVYATVIHAKCNVDGYKEEGITFPSRDLQEILMNEVYAEAGVDPLNVSYVEAHGSGTKASDPEECAALKRVFCRGRQGPLLVGALMTNMGHSESAAGICSLAKIILMIETGVIGKNLHFHTPNPNIPELFDNSIKIVDENTKFPGGYVGESKFGFGGANVHVILKANEDKHISEIKREKPSLPRLILSCGRTQTGVEAVLNRFEKENLPDAACVLLNKIAKAPANKMIYRGYAVVKENEPQAIKFATKVDSTDRPVWFVYSSLGNDWPAMANQLMEFDVFARSIHDSAQVLSEFNLDLIKQLTDSNSGTKDVTSAVTGIIAMQIALTDMMKAIGISPDGIVGHSFGEIACAYADGCLTASEAIKTAYWWGKSIENASITNGAMAAVEMPWNECFTYCGKTISMAYVNSTDSVTLAGPKSDIEATIKQLSAKNVFVREIESYGVPFHTKQLQPAAVKLEHALTDVLVRAQKKSIKWYSSCATENISNEQRCTPKYFMEAMTSTVLFKDAIANVPKNAIVIEVGPHGSLQAILKRALSTENVVLPLMKRETENPETLLSTIGRLHTLGINVNTDTLYPEVKFPVPRGTPFLSKFVPWNHSSQWRVCTWLEFPNFKKGAKEVVNVDVCKEESENKFLLGHRFGKELYLPESFFIFQVWRTITKRIRKTPEECRVAFENIVFHRPVSVPEIGSLKLTINIIGISGDFEILDNDALLVNGRAIIPRCSNFPSIEAQSVCKSAKFELSAPEIYKELQLRGYNLTDEFQCLSKMDVDEPLAKLTWYKNWVACIDGMLQFVKLNNYNRDTEYCTRIEHLRVDPSYHVYSLQRQQNELEVVFDPDLDTCTAGGIVIQGIKMTRLNTPAEPLISQANQFISYSPENTIENAVEMAFNVALDNCNTTSVSCLEFANTGYATLCDLVTGASQRENKRTVQLTVAIPNTISANLANAPIGTKIQSSTGPFHFNTSATFDLISCSVNENFGSTDAEHCNSLLNDNGFLMLISTKQIHNDIINHCQKNGLEVVSKMKSNTANVNLLRKVASKTVDVIVASDNKMEWAEKLKSSINTTPLSETIWLTSTQPDLCGTSTVVKELRRNKQLFNLRSLSSITEQLPQFSQNAAPFKDVLRHDFADNIWKNNHWGTRTAQVIDSDKSRVITKEAYLSVNKARELNWYKSQIPSNAEKQLCTVCYASIRDSDKKAIKDSIHFVDGAGLGQEFSGKDCQGNNVFGLVKNNALSTIIDVCPELIWKVPSKWTLEEACTVPVAFVSAYQALVLQGKLTKNQSILIQDTTEDISIAAIGIALQTGSKVLAAIGSPDNEMYLKQRFPQLTNDNFVCGSDESLLENSVLDRTHGKGVDVVFESVPKLELQRSVRCLSTNGRYLCMGNINLSQLSTWDTHLITKNITYIGVLLTTIFGDSARSSKDRKTISNLMQEGITSGVVKPFEIKVFNRDAVKEAFACQPPAPVKTGLKISDAKASNETSYIYAINRVHFQDNKTYVVFDGLSDFGLELTNWIIKRGAKNVVLISYDGTTSGYHNYCMKHWKELGVQVQTVRRQIASSVTDLLKSCGHQHAVGGIFNVAMMTNKATDATTAKQIIDEANLLDTSSRALCPELTHFVIFHSLIESDNLDNIIFASYAIGALQNLCERRNEAGLRALSIHLGPVIFSKTPQRDGYQVKQSVNSCIEELDVLLGQPQPVVSSFAKQDLNAKSELLKKTVSKVLSNNKSEATLDTTVSLSNLGINEQKASELLKELRAFMNPCVTIGDLLSKSIHELEQIILL